MKIVSHIQEIPIDQIRVLNPRVRNKKKFMEIVNSMEKLGNKMPIKVSPRSDGDGKEYDLVYGQGRLEAYKYLGATMIPAIVSSIPYLECLILSVEENIARRNPSSMEHIEWIKILREDGYTIKQVAQKINLSESYVKNMLRLLANGDERLINDVMNGNISSNLACIMATQKDKDVQLAMLELHNQGKLNGSELLRAQKAYAKYQAMGKKLHRGPRAEKPKQSQHALMRALSQATERYESMSKQAKAYENYRIFIEKALEQLSQDEEFVKLTQEENLETLPAYLVTGRKKSNYENQAGI